MRITGPSAATGSRATGKKNDKTKKPGFADDVADKHTSSGGVNVASTANIDALFMLQEVDEDAGGGGASAQEAFNALDYLEKIRLSLLQGDVDQEVLFRLERMIAQWRTQFLDPRLADIIDDIELRSAVEIAKWKEK